MERTAADPAAQRRSAELLFGPQADTALAFADLLATDGVVRGLVGPREAPRIWDRHVVNCAVVAEAVPRTGADLIDVGSGAGLPGIVLAIARPHLTVTLLEPLLRRTTFLAEVVQRLDLPNAQVLRGRAEELAGQINADTVTARAVAPLERLAGWCLPLVRPGGRLLAIKGERAAAELATVADRLPGLGAVSWAVTEYGHDVTDPPVRVVRIDR